MVLAMVMAPDFDGPGESGPRRFAVIDHTGRIVGGLEKLAEEGLFTLSAGSRVVRLLPPLTTSRGELEEALNTLTGVLSRR